MGYSKYVGRVGALALALGIGTAVATPAWAEAPSGNESASSASESSQKPSSRRTSPAVSGEAASSGDSTGTSDSDGSTTPADGKRDDDAIEDESDVEIAPETDAVEDTPPLVDEGVEESDADDGYSASVAPEVDLPSATVQSDDNRTSASESPVGETPASTAPDQDPEPSSAEITDAPAPPSYASAVTAPPVEPAPAPLVRQPRGPIGVILGGPAAMLDIAAKALHMLFNPSPTVPGDPPLLLGVLAFVRREIQRTFFNSSPTAVADSTSTSEGLPTRISVLDNDTDPDIGDVLTVTDFAQAANGVVELNADGSFTYTPTAGFSGTDTFSYTISDEASAWHTHGLFSSSRSHKSTATVTIAVTAAPTAINDSATVVEDSTANVIDVLGNDSDSDGDALTVTGVGEATHGGAVTVNPEGVIIYTPTADFNGDDTFTYTVSDGTQTATATVTVTVTPVNDTPVAGDDTATVAENSVGTSIAVLANDTDIDSGDSLSVTAVGIPSGGGAAAINADGTISYTPVTGYFGTESFTYTVSDGTESATGTVTVTITQVNDAPVAVDDTVEMSVGETSVSVIVVANDTDPDGDTLTVTGVTAPINGAASFSGGTVTYTPTEGFAGTETLTYTVSDGSLTDTATLSISVPISVAPLFAEPSVVDLSVQSNGVTTGRFVATDPQGDSVMYGLPATLDPVYATLVLNAETGEFVFSPTELARFNAAVTESGAGITFTVTASDGEHTTSLRHTLAVVPLHPDDDGILDLDELDTLAALGVVGVSENEDGTIIAVVGEFTDDDVHNVDDALAALNRIAAVLGAGYGLQGEIVEQSTEFGAGSGGVSENVYRLFQRINGIRVLGSEVILTTLVDGTATGAYSGINPAIYQVNTTAASSVDETSEVTAAASEILVDSFSEALDDDELAAFLASLSFDHELVIYGRDPAVPPALAWLVNVHTASDATTPSDPDIPFVSSTFYVYANGANAGMLLASDDAVLNAAASTTTSELGLAPGCSPRTCTITYQQDGGVSRMIDVSRNITIHRARAIEATRSDGERVEYGLLGNIVEKSSSGWDPSAVAAMHNMAKAYEYFKNLGWEFNAEYPGYGIQVGLIDEIYGVAQWNNGARTTLAYVGEDGSVGIPEFAGSNFVFGEDSEAALDIVGHEYTHAVIRSILRTGGFSGTDGDALDEAYGDFLGSLLENKDGEGRWQIGEDSAVGSLRDMRRVDPGNDGHERATIFDRAAHLMMTDSRTANVSKETWARIFYTSMKRLPSDATFKHARNAVIASAHVQGLNAAQQKAIAEAFDEVGISTFPQVKIVLTWGATPSDLDSHLTGPPSVENGPRFHVFYAQRSYFQDGSYSSSDRRLSADLDYDDTSSYGPESTTIRNLVAGDYYFYVHDYSNRGSSSSSAMSQSGATVKVYKPNQSEDQGLLGFLFGSILGNAPTTFQADNENSGTLWTVFKLTIPADNPNNPTISSINQYSFESSPAAVGQLILPEF